MTPTTRKAIEGILAYFNSGNALPVEKATIRGDSSEVQALRAALEQPAVESAEITEKRVAWVAFTNQDLTEGRGNDIPIAVCDIEATARRIAKKRYVQGSDGPVRAIKMIKIGREWYAPSVAYILASPTKEDRVYQDKLDARKSAEEKAKSLGLTDSELSDLGWRP